MKHFSWFHNFTQSLKSKFNNCITKKTFYPGAQIITEGTNNMKLYIIVEGTCNILCSNTSQKYSKLEQQQDPTKVRRDYDQNNN